MATTTWTAGNGSFTAAGNWNAGVPGSGVDAIITGTSTAPLAITFATSNIIANTLSMTYATLSMSSGSLTLQNASNMALAQTSTGFTQTGGTLEFQNGANNAAISYIAAVSQAAGTLKVDAGSLDVYGASSFSGTLAGAGDIWLRGGYTYTPDAGVSLTAAEILLYDGGSVLALNANVTYGGDLYLEYTGNNGGLNLGTSTLTLTGSDQLLGYIYGAGRVISQGTAALDNGTLGGSAVLENKGTVTEANGYTVGDSSASTAKLLNDVGAIINITGDNGIGRNGSTTLINSGTLEKTAGSGTSYIDPQVTSTGTIAANTGTLYFRDSDSFSGTIGGTGTVTLGYGYQYTVGAGTVLSVANLTFTDNGTEVTFAGNETYVGNLYLYNNSFLNLGATTLTLTTGSESIHGDIIGTGRLITTTSAFDAENMFIGGSVTLENKGTLTTAGGFTVGDSGSSTATLLNDIGATIAITGTTGIGRDGNASIINDGTLQFSGSGGTDYIDPIFTSPGTVIANIGTLYFRNADTFSGQINGTGTSLSATASPTT